MTKAKARRTPSGLHLAQRIGQHGMPVAIAPVDGQVRAAGGQFGLERGDQFASLIVDGALAAELVVVLGYFEHAFARDVPAAQHIFEERDDVFAALGAAEGDDAGERRRGE